MSGNAFGGFNDFIAWIAQGIEVIDIVLSEWSKRVWVLSCPVDMHKGCFSLVALVEREFSLDPRSACVFVFFARMMDKVNYCIGIAMDLY